MYFTLFPIGIKDRRENQRGVFANKVEQNTDYAKCHFLFFSVVEHIFPIKLTIRILILYF